MRTVFVKYVESGGEYPIYIGENLLDNGEVLRQHVYGKQVMIVSNETIAPFYLSRIQNSFASDITCNHIILPDGEQYKNLTNLNYIFDGLINGHHHRDTTLIALGGGVIGDMTGFAAASYLRGVNFIQIPTSLLAQVDASIGGKTGVNHPQGKNLIGAFHQPQAVIIDINTLSTLPDREFNSGIAEIIKAALVYDEAFFSDLENQLDEFLKKEPDTVKKIIEKACSIKQKIVAADLKEKNIRALLNLGHTFGHAIEQNLNYQFWLHGEAVAMGMILATELSAQLQWITAKEKERIFNLIQKAQLPQHLPKSINAEQMLKTLLLSDKKILQNKLRLILLKGIGHGVITDEVTEAQILSVIEQYLLVMPAKAGIRKKER